MQTSLQTDPLYQDLLGDPEVAALLGGTVETQAMIDVEIALAQAQSDLGVIPATVGAEMEAALSGFAPDPAALAAGITGSGVIVPALVAQMRRALPEDLGQWVHWGATSQDITDTAAMVQLGRCLNVLQSRLKGAIDALQAKSQDYSTLVMAGRTRSQISTPVTLGLRIAGWAQPLIELEQEVSALRSRVLRVQFGGASGANSVVALHGPHIAAHMAQALGLADAPPWHGNRAGLLAAAGWMLQVATSLSKMAGDMMISGRSEVGELRAGGAGGSSTMPQKANPVQSEIVVAMGTLAVTLHGGLAAVANPAEERDGTRWTVEWVLLPQLVLSVACALRHSVELARTLTPNPARIAQNIADNPGLMAEAASFALAEHMPRAEAQALVKQAALADQPFFGVLRGLSDAPINWDQVLDPNTVVTSCQQIADQIFTRRRTRS